MGGTQVKSPFKIEVAADRLSATITLREDADPQTISTSDVVQALEGAKVAVNDDTTSRIQEYVGKLLAEKDAFETVTIARGRPAEEGADGRFEWDESIEQQREEQERDEEAQRSHYSVSRFIVVNAGDRIGRIVPPVPGVPGVDVHFNPIAPSRKPQDVVLKENVALQEDGRTVIATASGQVRLENNELQVIDILEISGDVDFSVGNIDCPTAVTVRGNIVDLFKVRTQKSLNVGGAIEAAEVDAEGDVEVRGGILNRDKGHVRSGGQVSAKFCAEARLQAVGDVTVGKEVLNSRIETDANLRIPNGAIIGGQVYARESIEAKVIGSEAGVPTEVGVGVPESVLREARSVDTTNDKRRAGVEKIRQTIAPLLAQPKRLTREQKERATELMFEADMIEAEIAKSEKRAKEGLAAIFVPKSEEDEEIGPHVMVTSKVCQGVSIRIDDRVTTFVKEMKGPIRICKRKIKNHTVVAAVNQLSGSVSELNSRRVEFEEDFE